MQNQDRRQFLATLAAGISTVPTLGLAQASPWPTRPVRMVIPAAAGGATDRLGRMLLPEFLKAFGQPVVADNRAGSGGSIGTGVAAVAPPDGYTMLVSGFFNTLNGSLYKLSYDFANDFTHVAQLAYGPNVFVARSDFPIDTIAQLVAKAKAEPGAINFATGGVGTSGHLALELFQRAAGIRLTHVAYKSGAPALQDLLAGVVPLMSNNQDSVLPHIKAGKLKALAVTSVERNPLYPGAQSFTEAGYPDVVVTSWGGIAVPKHTPAPIVERIRAAVVSALQRPDVRQPLENDGWVVGSMSQPQFESFVRTETERMARIVRDANIQVQ